MLAAVDFSNPILWAVIIGWVLAVTLHEWAHGIVAHLGGDWTIRQRGGLSLNPLHYIHPVYSILLPAAFLLMGGVPLPGGANYVRTDLLRSRGWESSVSLAGPLMTFILFLACAIPLHPAIGWVDPYTSANTWTNAQVFCGAMAVVLFVSTILNLLPVPPLDGFGVIRPFLEPELQRKLTTPPTSTVLFLVTFVVIWNVPQVTAVIYRMMFKLLQMLAFGPSRTVFARAFNQVFFGHT